MRSGKHGVCFQLKCLVNVSSVANHSHCSPETVNESVKSHSLTLVNYIITLLEEKVPFRTLKGSIRNVYKEPFTGSISSIPFSVYIGLNSL